jgi:hypothetical protein
MIAMTTNSSIKVNARRSRFMINTSKKYVVETIGDLFAPVAPRSHSGCPDNSFPLEIDHVAMTAPQAAFSFRHGHGIRGSFSSRADAQTTRQVVGIP